MKDVIQKEETEMAEKTGIETPMAANEMERVYESSIRRSKQGEKK